MKIIKNNTTNEKETNSKFPIKVVCEHCGSEIELEERDVEVGANGCYYFNCPCCKEMSYIDNGIELTVDNLNFPQHYYDFSNGRNISNEEINQYVKICIDSLRNSTDKNLYHVSTGTGDTAVHVNRYDDDEALCVQVAKGYYEVHIPYTEEDKEKWCN